MMNNQNIIKLQEDFNQISSILEDTQIEYWYARDLQIALGYSEWRNFSKVIEKVKISCQTANIDDSYHFVSINKTIHMSKGATKTLKDVDYE